MKSKITREKIEDLNHYGVDVDNQLSSMLSEEIARSIDREILMGLGLEPKNKRRINSINKVKSKI